jgi:hypothetical protein
METRRFPPPWSVERQGTTMKILFFHWPSTVELVINQSSWASAEESNKFFCQQKHAHDQRRRAIWATRLPAAKSSDVRGAADCGEYREVARSCLAAVSNAI